MSDFGQITAGLCIMSNKTLMVHSISIWSQFIDCLVLPVVVDTAAAPLAHELCQLAAIHRLRGMPARSAPPGTTAWLHRQPSQIWTRLNDHLPQSLVA